MLRYQGDFKVDAAGNSYVAGFVSKTSVDDDWIISKYNSAGKKKWTVTFNDSLSGSDKPNGVAIDVIKPIPLSPEYAAQFTAAEPSR